MDKLGCRSEVDTQVKVGGVFSRNSPVLYGAAIVLLLPYAALLGMGGVQHVSDAHFLQDAPVLCCGPKTRQKAVCFRGSNVMLYDKHAVTHRRNSKKADTIYNLVVYVLKNCCFFNVLAESSLDIHCLYLREP